MASAAMSGRGNVIAAICGHGRDSRPENFTMRAASHRVKTLVMVESTAAAGGSAALLWGALGGMAPVKAGGFDYDHYYAFRGPPIALLAVDAITVL